MFNKLKTYLTKISPKSVITWFITICVLILGYNLLNSTLGILEFFGLKKTSDQNQNDKALKDVIEKGYTAPKGEKETLDYAGWLTYSNAIYNELKHSWIDDKFDTVYKALYRVNNLTDWNLFIKTFGLRQNYAFGIPQGQPMDLVSFLRYNLDANLLNEVNLHYAKKGLKIAL